MMKISIKREQSQAGLSFAERLRVGELCSGMRKKFRPQVKNKLLLLLELLLTAATGAWAQEQSETIATTAQVVQGTHFTISNNGSYADGDGMGADKGITVTPKNGEFITKVVITCGYGSVSNGNTSVSSGTKEISGGTITVTGVNATTFTFTYTSDSQFKQFVVYYTAAPAGPTSYTVSLKDNVKDADKWTVKVGDGQAQALPIGGLKGDGSETVTLQYTGRLKVKGVKATSDAAAEESDLLSGVFSVSSTKKVCFSKGNLQATYNGTDWTWAFAENQWDYIGNAAGNTSIDGNGTVSASNVTVDLFGWVGASSTWTGAAQYGISYSKATNNTDGYGNKGSDALKSDWGNTISDGNTWFTLTSGEWTYLLNARSASTVGGTEKGRYAKAKVNDVQGVILFPDTYTHPDGVTAPTGVNATGNAGWNGNNYDATAWAKMEAAGCVFLPAAGYRSQASVDSAGSCGQYWSSSPWTSNANMAYYVYFYSAGLLPARYGSRYNGNSVRLVQEVAPNP